MNWYKTTQINEEEINEGEIKYSPDGNFFVLGKNTKRNEGP